MKNLFAVVVTYNRADFLQNLLESFSRLSTRPDRIVVVDNASDDHTADVVARAVAAGGVPIHYERLSANVGGSGGFSRGVELAPRRRRRVAVAYGRRRRGAPRGGRGAR